MKKVLCMVLALLMSLLAVGTASADSADKPYAGTEIVVFNWYDYIDPSVIDMFTEETGITVKYANFTNNEEMYTKLTANPGAYDVIVPSDYIIERMIADDALLKLDPALMPNIAGLCDWVKTPAYDPTGEYSVPYMWGTLGILYNTTMVDEPITSWDAMFDEKYAGDVLLINNSRDALGMALYYLGYSVNTTDEAQIREAFQLLSDAVSKGVYQGKVMDEVFQKMEQGNAAIATYYAGDYLTMLENNPDLAYVVPEEGSNWFVDAMCILKDAQNVDEAHEWINFLASTEANLANMDYIWYASPNTEALEQYPAYYEETYGEPLDMELYEIMAAPQEVLDRCEAYLVTPPDIRNLYNELWTQLGIN